MREILFRGKRLDNDEWVEGYLEYFYSKDGTRKLHCFISIWGEMMHTVDPSTVGQFTGLLDKNGKRIFEGDVCRNTKTGEMVSVKWHGTMAGFVWSKRKEKSHLYDFGELFRAHDKYEVIVKDDCIISTGYNGSARGESNCCDVGECWRQAHNIPHGEQYEKCVAVHAEDNAISQAGREAIGATLYLAGLEDGKPIKAEPCLMCARKIRNARIKEVVTSEQGSNVLQQD